MSSSRSVWGLVGLGMAAGLLAFLTRLQWGIISTSSSNEFSSGSLSKPLDSSSSFDLLLSASPSSLPSSATSISSIPPDEQLSNSFDNKNSNGNLQATTTSSPSLSLKGASQNPLADFSSSVANKRFLVVQTDNRLNWLYDAQNRINSSNVPIFGKSVIGPSVWSVFSWAQSHNYSYLFVASPSHIMGPRAKQALGHYWAKIPVALYLLYLLQHAPQVEYLLLLDTDLSPLPSGKYNLEQYMEGLASANGRDRFNKAHIFVNNDDGSYYSALLASAHVYQAQGPLNSGSLVIRNSQKSIALFEKLWYNLTLVKSPFEMFYEKTTLHISWFGNDTLIPDRIVQSFRSMMGRFSRVSDPIMSLPANNKQNAMTMTLEPHQTDDEASFYAKKQKCCSSSSHCFSKVQGIKRVQVRCVDAKSKSTLYGAWPGDQDRLNWLRDMDIDGNFLAADVRSKPALSTCNVGKTNVVFLHWCNDYWTKVRFSEALALTMPVKNSSTVLEPWAIFRVAVPALKLPTESETLPTPAIVQDYLLPGNFQLWNV